MANTVSTSPGSASGSSGNPGSGPPVAAGPRRPWRPLTVLAAGVSLILGAVAGVVVQHALDQRTAARDLYRTQLLTTLSRFFDEEARQIALPVSQRSPSAFGDLAESIIRDQGVNGRGTLTVALGAGSTAPAQQIAFSVTVSSPYASTTAAVWYLGGGNSISEGACVLQSSLLGPGRATADLSLGGGEYLTPCSTTWWSPGPVTPSGPPRLGVAGIPEPPR